MNKDTLFELLDDELEVDQIEDAVEQLLNDQELQQTWHQQYLLRAAIRDRALVGKCDMVERVASALENEAVIIASETPAALDMQSAGTSSDNKVVYPNAWRRRYVAYAAVAASLLAVVLINLPQQPQETSIADTDTVQTMTPAAEQELQAMIVQHGEFSGAAALNGLVAYSKVVTAGAPTAGASQR